ncbi:hypothetical protein LDENG_00229450 [Lucifuga dentata]|nr:hypothetical protein LDENG_00229450 [Lucifuga dentata]
MVNLEFPIHLTCILWRWEEAGTPGGNLQRHGKNMVTPHKKAVPQPGIEPRTFLL